MATTSRAKKRIRVTRKPKSCPNPLFEKWLIELKEDAVRKESKLQYVYGKVKLTPKFYFAVFPATMKHFDFCYLQALKSLQKYPLVLESAKECKVLQHFGEGLCKIIDKKLADHIAHGGSCYTCFFLQILFEVSNYFVFYRRPWECFGIRELR